MAFEDKSTDAPTQLTADAATVESAFFHDDPPTGQVDHTPIIITDGSASIEFAENRYLPEDGNPNRRRSTDLHLMKVVANRNHTLAANPESRGRSCLPLVAGDLYEIEVTCTLLGQPAKNFLVSGGPTFSPVIEFDHASGGEYRKDSNEFPSIELGQRFGNLLRGITRLQIFRIENATRVRVHDCALATPGCEYKILDTH